MGQIGRLGLAVVGGYFGGPLGFALGSIAGGILFPVHTRLPDQTGPRLGESQLTGSEYGRGIPKVWGTYRVSGNVIWASPVHETKRSRTQKIRQGKGGGDTTSQTTHEFFYTQSFALALCEGIAKRVTKIYFDGRVVYDMTTTTGGTVYKGLKFRFYAGTEDQLPDSIIESYEGAGNVPAHRGLCYLVFDNLDITNYRRIPTIEVHVQMAGSDSTIERSFEGRLGGTDAAVNLQSRTLINWPVYADKQLASIDDLKVFRSSQVDYLGSARPLGPAPGGDFLVGNSTIWNDPYIHLVDAFTLQSKGSVRVPIYPQYYKGKYAVFSHISVIGKEHLVFIGDQSLKIIAPSNQPIAGDFYGNAAEVVFDWGPTGWRCYRFCHAYLDKCYIIMVLPGTTDRFAIYETAIVEDVFPDIVSGELQVRLEITARQKAQFTTLDINPEGLIPDFWGPWGGLFDLNNRNIDGMLYDVSDDSLIVSFGRHLVTVKISCSDWSIKWRFVSEPGGTVAERDSHSYDMPVGHDISGGTWLVPRGPRGVDGYLIDTTSGQPVKTFSGSHGIGIYRYWVYDSRSKTAYSEMYNSVLYFERPPGERVPVSEILEDLRSEIDAVPADYSGVAGFEVDGYARLSPTTSRSMIEPLASVFGFDGVDAGTHLRWIRRGGGAVNNVLHGDLIPGESQVIDFTRTQEVELPRLVSITYADLARDFEQSTYHASRYYGNEQYTTVSSSNQISIEAPMAIEATEVKRRADSMLREAWNSRDSAKFSIPRYFLEHEVGDVVTLLSPGRVPQDVRLDAITVGSNIAIEVLATAQDSSQYTSVVEAERGAGYIDQTIPSSRDLLTRLFMLPVPLLLDSNDRARQEILVQYAMGAASPNWQSGILEHDLGAGFVPTGSVQTDAVHGAIIGFVPIADSDTVFSTNENLTIRVAIATGTLESVTQEEMLAGANAAAIIHSDSRAEVIQFRDAVLDDDGNYTLSGILRGRRGTDYWATAFDSPAGATFVELTPDSVSATTAPLSELGRSRLYRGHEIRQEPENGDTRSVQLLGIDMMPYAPTHLSYTGDVGNDIALQWVRRTRIRGDLADSTPTVPLNEDAESYEIDIIRNNSVVRTLTSAIPEVVYTQAQQIEDSVGQFDILDVAVYQMSAQVGRGFPTHMRIHGTSLDVAQQSAITMFALGAPDIEVAQQSTVVMQSVESSLHVAQQSVILLHEEFELPSIDVAQQSNTILLEMDDPQPMDIAQQSNIILREV